MQLSGGGGRWDCFNEEWGFERIFGILLVVTYGGVKWWLMELFVAK